MANELFNDETNELLPYYLIKTPKKQNSPVNRVCFST